MKPKYTQLVSVHWRNGTPGLYAIQSASPITCERVITYFENKAGFNEENDDINFLDKPTCLNIDGHPKIKFGQCPVCHHYGDDCTGK